MDCAGGLRPPKRSGREDRSKHALNRVACFDLSSRPDFPRVARRNPCRTQLTSRSLLRASLCASLLRGETPFSPSPPPSTTYHLSPSGPAALNSSSVIGTAS